MSLRTRLIIAFLLLSVVPLSAVTIFWYASSVHAFERAAQREATQSATDLGRRMDFITADVGRRMDRLFELPAATDADPDADLVKQRVAPMLGDTAALVERVEYHPSRHPTEPTKLVPPPPAVGATAPVPPVPPAPAVAGVPPPPPPTAIVVDVGKMVEEARAAARGQMTATQLQSLGPLIDRAIQQGLPEAQANIQAAVEAMTREAAARQVDARQLQTQMDGRRVEIAVKKGGRVVGTANATLNLDRTLNTVMTFARREQGEVPFAVDPRGKLYTPDERQRPLLQQLGVLQLAPIAADGAPKRTGDWVVVARRDAGGLIFGIARPIGESLREIRRMSLRNLGMGLAVIALACIGIVPISHKMTQHVRSLSDGVRHLAGGDFKTRVPVQSSDELGALAAAFNHMAADLERHQALVVKQERLHKELELSRLIQTEMLPRARLLLGPAEIKGVSIPAREVGGDFFNYFAMPGGEMALLVGDVSGKGVSAALLMANVQATLRARLPLEGDLAKLADELDREMDATTPRGVYLTLFLAILDAEGRRLRYVNAGHNPQFLIRTDGSILPLASTGMPIALYAGQGYSACDVELGAGDLLFFYTDGLVETENERNEMFGAERLQAILASQHDAGVDGVLERVERTVRSFRGAAEPFDDATMMALRVNA